MRDLLDKLIVSQLETEQQADQRQAAAEKLLHGWCFAPSACCRRATCSAIGRGGFGVFSPSFPSTFSQITTGPGPRRASPASFFQASTFSNWYTRAIPAARARPAKSVRPAPATGWPPVTW